MAASRSTAFAEREVFEPCRSVSLLLEPCLLPKQDNEFDLELVLEFVREFDLDIMDMGRPRARGASSPTASSFLLCCTTEPVSVSRGDWGVSLL